MLRQFRRAVRSVSAPRALRPIEFYLTPAQAADCKASARASSQGAARRQGRVAELELAKGKGVIARCRPYGRTTALGLDLPQDFCFSRRVTVARFRHASAALQKHNQVKGKKKRSCTPVAKTTAFRLTLDAQWWTSAARQIACMIARTRCRAGIASLRAATRYPRLPDWRREPCRPSRRRGTRRRVS
jgi:hypothetical protein